MTKLVSALLVYLALVSTVFAGTAQVNNIGNVGGGGGSIANSAAPFALTLPMSSLGVTATAVGTYSPVPFWIYCGSQGGVVTTAVNPCFKDGVKYQVPVGSTAHALQVIFENSDATASSYQLMSDSAAFGFDTVVGSLAGPVYQGGASAKYVLVKGGAATTSKSLNIGYSFKGGSWPGVQASASGGYSTLILIKESTP